MQTLKKDVSVQITEKKSIFYADAFFVRTEAEALAALETVKRRYPDATHHVYAYSLRESGIRRFSDAGEPSGTAGMPVLKVIDFNGLVDTCIVVTRYFGGVLLGAGGLVRAYTKVAADAVEAAGKTDIISAVRFSLEYGYDLHNIILRALQKHLVAPENQIFTEKVYIEGVLEKSSFEALRCELDGAFYTNIIINVEDEFCSRKV